MMWRRGCNYYWLCTVALLFVCSLDFAHVAARPVALKKKSYFTSMYTCDTCTASYSRPVCTQLLGRCAPNKPIIFH